MNAPPLPGGAGLRPGVLRPPARSWLTADRRGLLTARKAAVTRKAPQAPGRRQHPAKSRKRGPGAAMRTPRWRAERRHAPANGRVHLKEGCAGRRAVPLAFAGERKGKTAYPAPQRTGAMARARILACCLTIEPVTNTQYPSPVSDYWMPAFAGMTVGALARRVAFALRRRR